ncbi:MAG: hypothetical protein ACAI44_30480 [Candidatus Sericytochromatia bacterium]
MAENTQRPVTLPPEIQGGLDRFCEQIRSALGTDLISVVLYGDLVKGQPATSELPTELMLVLKQSSVDQLDKLVEPLQEGIQAIRLSLMLTTPEDLRSSTDVFPIKFMDIQRHHQLLWGSDSLAEISIAREHLRLRCEQECKNLLLRLRRSYVLRARQPEMLAATLKSSLSPLLSDLEVLYGLETGQPRLADASALIAAVAGTFDFDPAPLKDVLELKNGGSKPDSGAVKSLYGRFLETIERIAGIADRLKA